jgi:hypothetical protein
MTLPDAKPAQQNKNKLALAEADSTDAGCDHPTREAICPVNANLGHKTAYV